MYPTVDVEDPESALERAAGFLRAARRVVALTGAGVSAESGVPTFRDSGGLWEGHRVEEVATPAAFRRDPELVWRFYNLRRAALGTVSPNPGHVALMRLEERFPAGDFTLVTQNVDGPHRRAGSRNLLELHGNLARTRCTGCGAVEDRGAEPLGELPHCTRCGALLRPDVVWFTEALPDGVYEAAFAATERCDCFLVVGTSAVVYPAAGLVPVARRAGAAVIEVNLTRTDASDRAEVNLFGPSGQILPRLVERLS